MRATESVLDDELYDIMNPGKETKRNRKGEGRVSGEQKEQNVFN